jgi:hypothetical protein
VVRGLVGLTAALLVGGVLAGCSDSKGAQDDLQSAPTLVAATPAVSPVAAVTPSGTVTSLPGPASGVVADAKTGTLAIAVDKPAELLLVPLSDPGATPAVVPLPGAAAHLSLAAPGGPVLAPVPSANQVVEVALPSATTTVVPVPGGPTSAATFGNQLLVAVPGSKTVDVVTGGKITRTITGDVSPEEVFVSGTRVVIVDRLRSAVFDVEASAGTVGAGQRAGNGATNAAIDGYGRVLVTDSRSGELLAFSLNPVLLRQRYPVSGVPYGIAVDTKRHLAWVTATQLNQVIGYDLAGGAPVEKYRLPTVRQPDAVAVDPDSGRVIVASADGGGVQVMQP